MTETEDRAEKAEMKDLVIARQRYMAKVLKHKGYTNVAISRALGLPESTVRHHLKEK